MRITKYHLERAIKSRGFYSRLKEASEFSYKTYREAGFLVVKEIGANRYHVSRIRQGNISSVYDPEFDSAKEAYESDYEDSYSSLELRQGTYILITAHTHPGEGGPIVPSILYEYSSDRPGGDFPALRAYRRNINHAQGLDVKSILATAKVRKPRIIDLLLVQERTDQPIGHGGLLEIESALYGVYEIDSPESLDESYQATEEVAKAIRGTGLYAAEQIRFRSGKPLKEDLEKLASFEFEEKRL